MERQEVGHVVGQVKGEPSPSSACGEVLTVQEAADLLSLSPRSVRRLVAEDKLRAVRVRGLRGPELRLDRGSVLAYRLLQPDLGEPVGAVGRPVGRTDGWGGYAAAAVGRSAERDSQSDDGDGREDDADSRVDRILLLHTEELLESLERERDQAQREADFLRERLQRAEEAQREFRALLLVAQARGLQDEPQALPAAEEAITIESAPPRRPWWRRWRGRE